MMRLTFCALVALAALIASCGHNGPPKTQPLDGSGMVPRPRADASCPLEVPGTSVTVEDTTNGAALVFVTTGDVAAVRTRAQGLATMHTKHDGPGDAMGMMFPAEWTAAEKDIDTGARVEFSAAKPEDAATVQSQLRMHAGHLSSGSCAM